MSMSSFKYFEWSVQLTKSIHRQDYESENIPFLDSYFCLVFSTAGSTSNSTGRLYFYHDVKTKLPIKVAVFSNFSCVSETEFFTCSGKIIWEYIFNNGNGINEPYKVIFKILIYVDFSKGSAKCFSCKESLETEFISLHTKCIDRQVKCPDCSGVFLLQDWLRGHECQKKREEDKSLQTPSYIDNCFLMEEISRAFSKMFDDNSSQDVEFIVGDQTIKAHKKVLSCRSDVFASMLQSDMSEGRTGRVNIEDMDAKHFRELLEYLYTGVLPTLTVDTAMKFYEAGDKYNIYSLKKQCADFLMDYLSTENVYDILIFADRHSDADIKRGANDFLVKEKMPDSGEKWVEFCKQYPMLAVDVYRLFNKHLLPNEY